MKNQIQLNIRVQRWVAFTSLGLFGIKILAFYWTNSMAILTDALESTVNVLTGFTGLYALLIAARPRDEDHPYGHGKAELVSASLEGILIVVAGMIIIYEALINLQHPHAVQQLDVGMILVGITAIINFGLGHYCKVLGKKNHSIALQASGKHLQSDTYTTAGIIVGLLLLKITAITWIDSAVALIFASWIIIEGIAILRSTISGIMDEADDAIIQQLIVVLNQHRHDTWVDLHNLRTIKFGQILHVDCHLTVPWYFQVRQGHEEVSSLERLIDQSFDHQIEMFVHLDACAPPFSCGICPISNCLERKKPFEGRLTWTAENVISNSKHGLPTPEKG